MKTFDGRSLLEQTVVAVVLACMVSLAAFDVVLVTGRHGGRQVDPAAGFAYRQSAHHSAPYVHHARR